jgi:hypothetical protein
MLRSEVKPYQTTWFVEIKGGRFRRGELYCQWLQYSQLFCCGEKYHLPKR